MSAYKYKDRDGVEREARDLHEILGKPRGTSYDDLKAAWRNYMRQNNHDDNGGNNPEKVSRAQEANAAWDRYQDDFNARDPNYQRKQREKKNQEDIHEADERLKDAKETETRAKHAEASSREASEAEQRAPPDPKTRGEAWQRANEARIAREEANYRAKHYEDWIKQHPGVDADPGHARKREEWHKQQREQARQDQQDQETQRQRWEQQRQEHTQRRQEQERQSEAHRQAEEEQARQEKARQSQQQEHADPHKGQRAGDEHSHGTPPEEPVGGRGSPPAAGNSWNRQVEGISGRIGTAAVIINTADAVITGHPGRAVAVVATAYGTKKALQVIATRVGAEYVPVAGQIVGGVFAGVDSYNAARSGHTTRAVASGLEATLYAVSAGAAVATLADCWNPTVIAPGAVALIAGGLAVTMTAARTVYDSWNTLSGWFGSHSNVNAPNSSSTRQTGPAPAQASPPAVAPAKPAESSVPAASAAAPAAAPPATPAAPADVASTGAKPWIAAASLADVEKGKATIGLHQTGPAIHEIQEMILKIDPKADLNSGKRDARGNQLPDDKMGAATIAWLKDHNILKGDVLDKDAIARLRTEATKPNNPQPTNTAEIQLPPSVQSTPLVSTHPAGAPVIVEIPNLPPELAVPKPVAAAASSSSPVPPETGRPNRAALRSGKNLATAIDDSMKSGTEKKHHVEKSSDGTRTERWVDAAGEKITVVEKEEAGPDGKKHKIRDAAVVAEDGTIYTRHDDNGKEQWAMVQNRDGQVLSDVERTRDGKKLAEQVKQDPKGSRAAQAHLFKGPST